MEENGGGDDGDKNCDCQDSYQDRDGGGAAGIFCIGQIGLARSGGVSNQKVVVKVS